MNRFGRATALVFGVCISLVLASCGQAGVDSDPNAMNRDYESVMENYCAETEDYDVVEFVTQTPFTGEIVQRSDFFWQDERDLDWEADVRGFAIRALRQHPLLMDFDLSDHRFVHGMARDDYAAGVRAYEVLLRRAVARNGIEADGSIDDIRATLRSFFIQKVNELVLEIPYLSDYEIIFELAAIAAVLDDAHTRMGIPMGDVFPVELISLYDGIYLIGVPDRYGHALYGELIAINDIEIDEIIDRLAKIVAHENGYYLRHKITASVEEDPVGLRHYVVRPFLKELLVLNYLSVVDGSGIATFTVKGIDSEIFDIQLSAVARDAMSEDSFALHEFGTLKHINSEEPFWHEYFPNDNLIYVRIQTFEYLQAGTFSAAATMLRTELENRRNSQKLDRLIVDLRQNAGGWAEWPTASEFLILSETVEHVYVIIDSGTFSRGVTTTSNIIRYLDNVTVLGEPSGQVSVFFAGGSSVLPNSRMRYNISQEMVMFSDSEDIAIRPDIFIPLTIHDIIDNRDPVMDFVLGL